MARPRAGAEETYRGGLVRPADTMAPDTDAAAMAGALPSQFAADYGLAVGGIAQNAATELPYVAVALAGPAGVETLRVSLGLIRTSCSPMPPSKRSTWPGCRCCGKSRSRLPAGT